MFLKDLINIPGMEKLDQELLFSEVFKENKVLLICSVLKLLLRLFCFSRVLLILIFLNFLLSPWWLICIMTERTEKKT